MKAATALVAPIPEAARTIIYTRVSTEDQAADDRASLAHQEAECRVFAEARGRRVDFVWSDPGVSGRDEERLERLTTWCEAHARPKGTGLILVLNASRWGRFVHNPHASAFFRYRLAKAGWAVEQVQQPSTGNRTTDGVLAVIHDSQAAAESSEKADRAHSGMLGQAKLGRWLGRAPFGYTRVAVTEAGKERRLDPFEHAAPGERVRLAPGNPADVRTVRLIFTRYTEGGTLRTIAEELNAAGTPGPFDTYRNRGNSKRWRRAVVRALLQNRAYVGTQVWNRRQASETPKGPRPVRPAAEWVVVENAHPPLIDKPTFDAAQRRLKRGGPRRREASPQPFLLSGLFRCATCGFPVVGGGGTRPGARDPGAVRFYRCNGGQDDRYDRPPCRGEPKNLTVNQRWLEATVIEKVAEHVGKLVKSGALADLLDERLGAKVADRRSRVALEKERADLQAQRKRIVDRLAKGLLTDEDAAATLTEIKAGLARVERDLRELRLEPTRTDLMKERDRLLKLAADFPAVLRRATPAAARELLGHWVASASLNKVTRQGKLVLRRLPAAGRLYKDTLVLPGQEKPCSPGESRPSSPK